MRLVLPGHREWSGHLGPTERVDGRARFDAVIERRELAGATRLPPLAAHDALAPLAGPTRLAPLAARDALAPLAGPTRLAPLAAHDALAPLAGPTRLAPLAGLTRLAPLAGRNLADLADLAGRARRAGFARRPGLAWLGRLLPGLGQRLVARGQIGRP
jgi:hypothetical protein